MPTPTIEETTRLRLNRKCESEFAVLLDGHETGFVRFLRGQWVCKIFLGDLAARGTGAKPKPAFDDGLGSLRDLIAVERGYSGYAEMCSRPRVRHRSRPAALATA